MPLETTPIVGLPADRLYDWNPGLDSVGGVPDRTTIFTTVYPGGDIQAAIDACPSGEVVQLAAGTFTVNNFLLINKDITLRGVVDPVTNAPLTVLQKTNGATPGSYTAPDYQPIIIVGPGRYNNQTSTSTNLTSDAVAGTYSVTLASTAGLSPGEFVLLDEDDYTNASFIPLPDRNGSPTSAEILASDRVVFMDHSPSDPGDDPFPDSLTWFSRMGRPLNELKEIASISGNTVTFTSPITITYTVSKTAQLTSFDDTFVKYAGIENLSLKGGSDGNVRFEDAAYSWMKNCEDTDWLGEGVAIDSSFRIEVRDSYIHDGAWPEPGGGGYAISLAGGSAEALIENNIILRANKMMVGRSAGAGTVVAYNYTDDGYILTDPSWQEVGINGSHMAGSHSWLFEGNESFNYDSDNTHGNAIYMTVFRNDLTGDRTDFSNPEGNARAVGLMFGSWWQSIIGNVLGTPGQMTDWAYQSPGLGNQWGNDNIWEIGYDPQHWEQDADPKTVSTLIQGGNYDSVTDSVHWEDIPSQTLPNSLYLSGKPAFFGSYTWPWVDPTGSAQLYILPAKARYDAGTPFVSPSVSLAFSSPAAFDASYLSHNPDVARAGVDPLAHYLTTGWKEGRDPDAFFSTRYYENQNPDVAAAGINPLVHYEQYGWHEGRDPSLAFSTNKYLQAYPDVAAAGMEPLSHYLHYGQAEHRMTFISTPHGTGQQNPLVDNAYYFSQYQDVAAAGVNPFTHYDTFGWHEGRNPDALFNTAYYLQQNPDVRAAGIDPLLHYEQYGWKEGRNPSSQFSTSQYLAANPDVAAAGMDPLVHYEQNGLHEGRAIFSV